MSVTLDAVSWMQIIGLGGGMGALGQGIRTIVGIKKLNDAASGTPAALGDLIEPSRIWVSLAIGFIAGSLAGVSLITDLAHVSSQQIFMLMAAGYSGSDFIEGFMSRAQGTPTVAAGQEVVGTGTSSGGQSANPEPETPSTNPAAADGSVG